MTSFPSQRRVDVESMAHVKEPQGLSIFLLKIDIYQIFMEKHLISTKPRISTPRLGQRQRRRLTVNRRPEGPRNLRGRTRYEEIAAIIIVNKNQYRQDPDMLGARSRACWMTDLPSYQNLPAPIYKSCTELIVGCSERLLSSLKSSKPITESLHGSKISCD